jgi:tRNA(adenine34) deaminase
MLDSAFAQIRAFSVFSKVIDGRTVAQLDRATGYEPVGRGFESLQSDHLRFEWMRLIDTKRSDEAYMLLALDAAATAAEAGEVPVGAVVVLDDEVIGVGHNAPIGRSDPTAHAEVQALRAAATRIGNYRLVGATLYSTMEPCMMCLGASLHARIKRLVYGADDPKVSATTQLRSLQESGAVFNHRFEIERGVLADRAGQLVRDFFERRRMDSGAA